MTRVAMAAGLLLFTVSAASADPPPATGKADAHNPHGTPPGQSGTTPGNSGAANPHGAPPGQRIGVTGAEAAGQERGASPAPAGALAPGAGWLRLPPTTLAPFATEPIPLVPRAIPAEVTALLRRLKGWEPSWVFMARRFPEVDVTIRTVTDQDGARRVITQRFRQRDLASRQDLSTPDGTQSWLRTPPRMWYRHGNEPWRETARDVPFTSLNPNTLGLSDAILLQNFWEATAVRLSRDPGGVVQLGFARHGGGRMTWGVQGERTPLVRWIEAYDAGGRLEFREEREEALEDGRAVLLSRMRRTRLPRAELVQETLTWQTREGSVDPEAFTP